MIQPHPEAVARAATVRAELRLGDEPVPDIITVLEQRGLAVYVEPDSQAASGAYLPRPRVKAVFLNGTLPLPRLRCVAAHELGHHEFGDEPVVDRAISAEGESAVSKTSVERRADAFASNFLMPESGIAARLGLNAIIDTEAVLRLATQFGVTYGYMVERLEALGVLAPREMRQLLGNHAAALSTDYRHVEVRQQRLPADYVRRAFEAYGAGQIALGKLRELLRIPRGGEAELVAVLKRSDYLQPEDAHRSRRKVGESRRPGHGEHN